VLGAVIGACQQDHAAMVAESVRAQRPDTGQEAIDKSARELWKRDWAGHPAVKYAAGLCNARGIGALREVMATQLGVAPEFLAETRPYWLNVSDRIAVMLPADGEPWEIGHHPAWRMTYCVDVPWSPGAECPEFKDLLWQASGRDQDVYYYLIKVLGYAMLGRNPHHLVFFLSGPTANGKTTILHIVSELLGPLLAYEAKPELIARSKNGRHARHEATLRGKRLVTISETNDQILIDENQLKTLTGSETIAVELLYDKTMTMTPVTWVIIVANNEMPSLSHLDPALRRRIVVIPMGETIPAELRDTEKARRIIEREKAGILQLLIWGARAAMAEGDGGITSLPLAVEMKTRAYETEQNQVAAWFADRCLIGADSGPVIEGSECYDDFTRWVRGVELSRKTFHALLRAVPGVVFRGDDNHARYSGFSIRGVANDWTR
jgi:putative DNA primase/helicase